jgi:hypothetical protein
MSDLPPLHEDLLKGAKAAAHYIGAGVTPRTIYGMVERGFLSAVKVGTGKNAVIYFRKSAIDAAFKATEAA